MGPKGKNSHLRSEQQMQFLLEKKNTRDSSQQELFHTTYPLSTFCIAFLITVATSDDGCNSAQSSVKKLLDSPGDNRFDSRGEICQMAWASSLR